jgi:hypothetical protein
MEVHMWRRIICATLPIGALAIAIPAHAQSKAAKIASALAAAPASVSQGATVKDLPDSKGEMAVLREGSNGWVCVPSHPKSKYVKNDAMCLDDQWQEWMSAMAANRAPHITRVGYAYMLTANEWASNTDMKATAPTPDNQWHKAGPHVMVLYPDAKLVDALPKRPSTSGPYVMAAGTPYAHVMWRIR